MKTVGIIGFGSFGKFLAEKLHPYCKVLVFSASGKESQWKATLEEVATADYVILSIPLDGYESLLVQLKPLLSPSSIIVDVCSVKEKPISIIREILPEQKMLATHPLFGPESAVKSLEGHSLVLCPEESDSEALEAVGSFATSLGLEVVVMSAAEHDREMAVVQGLTFFIARALKETGIHNQRLSTPSFERLLSLAKLEQHHSDELFYTIQAGNDQTDAIRREFIDAATRLNNVINGTRGN